MKGYLPLNKDLYISMWIWITVLLVGIIVASFLTYHDLRRKGVEPFSLPEKIWQRKKERIEQLEPYLSRTPKILYELASRIQQLVDEMDVDGLDKRKLKKVTMACFKIIDEAKTTVPYPIDKIRDEVQQLLNDNELGMYNLVNNDPDASMLRKELEELRFKTSRHKLKTDLKEFLDESCHMGEALLFKRYANIAGIEISSIHDWIKTREKWMESLNQISSSIIIELDEVLSMGQGHVIKYKL